MAAQIAAISVKVEQAAAAGDPDQLYDEIERRVAALSQMMAHNHEAALVHGERLIGEVKSQIGELAAQSAAMPESIMETLDARFDELTARLDTRAGGWDEQAFASIEARLEDLALRLKESVSQVAALDPQIVRELQKQIGELAEHLAQPNGLLPDFEDLGPRLARIELSLAENQETVIEAARRAAEEALASLRETPAYGEGGVDLSAEIKALETLARRSDDRNARTFEAIHDTLLKIVERLSTLESETDVFEERETVKLAVGAAPSLDPLEEDAEETAFEAEASVPALEEEDEAERHFGQKGEPQQKLTPAQAAAAAAEAALSDQAEAEPDAVPQKRSMLGGLTRAFAPRRDRAAAAPSMRKEPSVDEAAPQVEKAEPVLDEEQANEPLEPGSGAPDLNAIMRRVRDEGLQATRHSEGDAAKADFIAAARRAAQAAAAEAETLKRKKGGEARGSTGRFGGLLRSRKSTALMAVAAIAIIAGGVGAARLMSSNDEKPVKIALAAPEKAPIEEVKAATVPANPEKPADTEAAAAPPEAAPSQAAKTEETTATPAQDEAEVEAVAAEPALSEPAEMQTASVDTDKPATDSTASETAVEQDSAAPEASTAADEAPEQPAAMVEEAETASLGVMPESLGPLPLRQAALSGDPKALFAVAEHYAQGHGVEADAATAAKYYEKAAETGLAPAQYRIGNDYEKGIGVARDIEKAKEWYRKAAEQGNASAMHNLGVLHAMGADGNADNDEAVKWFSRAAALGVKDSQFNLGILFAKGVGVERNLQEAYKWFALVAKTGDKDAAGKRDEIAKMLDADVLEQAKAKAELWKAKPVDRAANVVDLPAEWTDRKTTMAAADLKKAVTNIQLILNKNGYSAGPADGVMGEKTKSAIIAFQKDNGLTATGEVDTKLVQALLAHK
jgi:localization factor PodJL